MRFPIAPSKTRSPNRRFPRSARLTPSRAISTDRKHPPYRCPPFPIHRRAFPARYRSPRPKGVPCSYAALLSCTKTSPRANAQVGCRADWAHRQVGPASRQAGGALQGGLRAGEPLGHRAPQDSLSSIFRRLIAHVCWLEQKRSRVGDGACIVGIGHARLRACFGHHEPERFHRAVAPG